MPPTDVIDDLAPETPDAGNLVNFWFERLFGKTQDDRRRTYVEWFSAGIDIVLLSCYIFKQHGSMFVVSAHTTVRVTFPHTVSISVAIIKPRKIHNFAALKWIQLIKRNHSSTPTF